MPMPMSAIVRGRLFLLVLLAPLVLLSCVVSPPVTHTVTIDGSQFVPSSLTVHPGDVVVWVNKDPFPHTATSDAGRFDSHEIAPNQSWTFKPSAKGTFAYICTLHVTMKGTLRVE